MLTKNIIFLLWYLCKLCPDNLYDLRVIFQDTRKAEVRSMLIITGEENPVLKCPMKEEVHKFIIFILHLVPTTLDKRAKKLI